MGGRVIEEKIPLNPPFSKWEAQEQSLQKALNNQGFYSPLWQRGVRGDFRFLRMDLIESDHPTI